MKSVVSEKIKKTLIRKVNNENGKKIVSICRDYNNDNLISSS